MTERKMRLLRRLNGGSGWDRKRIESLDSGNLRWMLWSWGWPLAPEVKVIMDELYGRSGA